MELDEENIEFNNAAEFVRHTDKLIYLTGKAGTGKTTFLKYIKKTSNKNTVVLAPTGVAAINAGGVTINSFFQIPFGPFVPNDSRLTTSALGREDNITIYSTFRYNNSKLEIIKNLDLLIIDEISMVRADTLDVIDRILKVFRKKTYLPFGGVQVILIGDTFQLPPIAKPEVWGILSKFYKTPFFFSSKAIENNKPLYIELKKIYRQNEQEFIDLLNRVRINEMNPVDFRILNSKYQPNFSSDDSDYIILATHNRIVNETNLEKLKRLNTQQFTFQAKITGSFPDNMKPTDQFLHLKVGAQIMFIKNDNSDTKQYYNGKIGKIKELSNDRIKTIFDNNEEVIVERSVWENIKYSYDSETNSIKEEEIGTFVQFPIRLAWAITVHKSQGLTFEKVIADLSGAFASGQVYVALSRCITFSGLILKSQLQPRAISTDPRVIEFARNETPGTLIKEELNTGKADFYYKKAREQFSIGEFPSAIDYFTKARKFRNDIDTESFKKFITISGKRLLTYKNKNATLIKEIKLHKNKLLETTENAELKNQEDSNLREQVLNQLNTINLLEKDITNSQNEILSLKRQHKRVENKLSDNQIYVNELKDKLRKAKSNLQKRNKQIRTNKSEIQRLNALKWYDKLIGRK